MLLSFKLKKAIKALTIYIHLVLTIDTFEELTQIMHMAIFRAEI
jgi:hypothetical protein